MAHFVWVRALPTGDMKSNTPRPLHNQRNRSTPQARVRQRGEFSFISVHSVAIVAKPLPGLGVRVPERMDALIAEHDDRLVLVVLEKLVYLAWLARFPAMSASGSGAGLHVHFLSHSPLKAKGGTVVTRYVTQKSQDRERAPAR